MALIYIVEDDKNISEIESFSLKNAGHQTVEFPDGRSFYKELAEKKPDLILDRKSTRLNSSHIEESRMPSSA